MKKSKNCAYTLNILKNWLNIKGLKLYKDFLLKTIRVEREITEDEYINYKRVNNTEIEQFKLCRQLYKISLNNSDINKILEIFNKDNLKHLEQKHAIYFYDLDATKDIFNI